MYLDFKVALSPQAVAVLSSYNDPESIFFSDEHDQKFIRVLSIATYTHENFKSSNFAPAKRNFMQKVFEYRAGQNEERKHQFNELFTQAIKEGIARNAQKAAKLNKIQLPLNIFKKK